MRPTLEPHHLHTLQLIAAGTGNAALATHLRLAEESVKYRVRSLLDLLGARDRAEAVAIGYQAGILAVECAPVLDHLPAAGVPVSRLVEARLDLGWTQAEMAARLAMSSAWLCVRESGERPFTVGTARRYAELVGVDLSDSAL